MKKKFFPAELKIPSKVSKDQRYYLAYKILNNKSGKYERFRDYVSRVDFVTDKEQLTEAKRLQKEINLTLEAGTHVRLGGKRMLTKMETAFETIWEVWQQRIKRRTINTYNTMFRFFFSYCKEQFSPNLTFANFTREMASGYADYVEIKKHKPKTVLNHVSLIHTLFAKLQKRGFVKMNPFDNLDLPSDKVKRIRYVEAEDRNMIFKWLKENDPDCYLYCLCIYYLLARPVELINVQIRDINFKEQKIRFSHKNVKNDIDKYTRIPDVLMPVFLDKQLDKYNANCYLFTKGFRVGAEAWKYTSRPGDVIRKYRNLNNWKSDFVAYDLKPTGIQDYLVAGVPVDQVQLQAGITWEEMATYLELKKMRMPGLELMKKAPELVMETKWKNNIRVKAVFDQYLNLDADEREMFDKAVYNLKRQKNTTT